MILPVVDGAAIEVVEGSKTGRGEAEAEA